MTRHDPTPSRCSVCIGPAPVRRRRRRAAGAVRRRRPQPAQSGSQRSASSAVRLLREAKHPEAVDADGGARERSDRRDPARGDRRRAVVLPGRRRARAQAAWRWSSKCATPAARPRRSSSGRWPSWPRPAPPELVDGLLQAVDDENPRVRLEAIYALGSIARPPLDAQWAAAAHQGARSLRSGDPRRGRPRRRPARGEGRRRRADQGGQRFAAPVRYAAMRALGAIREERAVQALTEQFKYYGKGEGAWSALDALARIGHASSVPLFKARLADKDPFLRRAAAEGLARTGDTSEVPALEIGAGNDGVRDGARRDGVRAAEARAELHSPARRVDGVRAAGAADRRTISSSSARRSRRCSSPHLQDPNAGDPRQRRARARRDRRRGRR